MKLDGEVVREWTQGVSRWWPQDGSGSNCSVALVPGIIVCSWLAGTVMGKLISIFQGPH